MFSCTWRDFIKKLYSLPVEDIESKIHERIEIKANADDDDIVDVKFKQSLSSKEVKAFIANNQPLVLILGLFNLKKLNDQGKLFSEISKFKSIPFDEIAKIFSTLRSKEIAPKNIDDVEILQKLSKLDADTGYKAVLFLDHNSLKKLSVDEIKSVIHYIENTELGQIFLNKVENNQNFSRLENMQGEFYVDAQNKISQEYGLYIKIDTTDKYKLYVMLQVLPMMVPNDPVHKQEILDFLSNNNKKTIEEFIKTFPQNIKVNPKPPAKLPESIVDISMERKDNLLPTIQNTNVDELEQQMPQYFTEIGRSGFNRFLANEKLYSDKFLDFDRIHSFLVQLVPKNDKLVSVLLDTYRHLVCEFIELNSQEVKDRLIQSYGEEIITKKIYDSNKFLQRFGAEIIKSYRKSISPAQTKVLTQNNQHLDMISAKGSISASKG